MASRYSRFSSICPQAGHFGKILAGLLVSFTALSCRFWQSRINRIITSSSHPTAVRVEQSTQREANRNESLLLGHLLFGLDHYLPLEWRWHILRLFLLHGASLPNGSWNFLEGVGCGHLRRTVRRWQRKQGTTESRKFCSRSDLEPKWLRWYLFANEELMNFYINFLNLYYIQC